LKSGDHAESGGLAGAIWDRSTPHDLSSVDGKLKIVHGNETAEPSREVFDLENGHSFHPLTNRRGRAVNHDVFPSAIAGLVCTIRDDSPATPFRETVMRAFIVHRTFRRRGCADGSNSARSSRRVEVKSSIREQANTA